MHRHTSNTASVFLVFIAVAIFSVSLAAPRFCAAATPTTPNTRLGTGALGSNTTGTFNTAIGLGALRNNTEGIANTATGHRALFSNTTSHFNTASGFEALHHNRRGFNNTASGSQTLHSNTDGTSNTAIGSQSLFSNLTGRFNTASGFEALRINETGSNNTAIGAGADVSAGNLTNATAIGNGAIVDASNKVRVGNTAVTMIEGQVSFTGGSDKNKKENFQPVDGEEVLRKIRGFELSSWNFIGHDPKKFRHYGPMAQDFFAAFGHDGMGHIGSETTIKLRRHGRDSYDRRSGVGEAHGGAKREGRADSSTGIESGRPSSEVRLL